MITFLIEYGDNIKQNVLQYLDDECSFYTGNSIYQADMELILNKISLTVSNNYIVDVGGFCGYAEWIKSNIKVPNFKKGLLILETDLDSGFAYDINEEGWPVYMNNKTGWVCVGYPDKEGKAVEFINNCVAVVDNKQELVSLWLKPINLLEIDLKKFKKNNKA